MIQKCFCIMCNTCMHVIDNWEGYLPRYLRYLHGNYVASTYLDM